MAHPPTVTPYGPAVPAAIRAKGVPAPAAQAAQPADLNTSWRGLMSAIGVGLPYQLNRAARRARTMHRAVS